MRTCIRVIILLLVNLALQNPSPAQDDAFLNAASLTIDETENGIVINLEGPVEINFRGDRLTADYATVTLGRDLDSIESALETIELTGRVEYTGRSGGHGSSGQITYDAIQNRITLSGSAHLSRDEAEITAGMIIYHRSSGQVNIPQRCTIRDGDITVQADSAEYNIDTRTGSVSGDVTVTYRLGRVLYGDEHVEEVIVRSEAIYVSADDGEVLTPSGTQSGRTTLEAGSYSVEADNLVLSTDASGISDVDVEGDVRMAGPEMQHLNADRIFLSTADRLLTAEGNVDFTIRGQSGSADLVELNFAEGWSIRLEGASISGDLEEVTEAIDEEPG
jgi:lipopolysaccharide export system protein LptA